MPGEKPLLQESFLAAADLSEKRYHAVKLDSAGKIVLAGAGEASIGILQRGEGIGKVCPVMMLGISYAILGAAVATPGTNLTPDAAGKLVTANGTDKVIAYNLKAGNAGDIIPVCLVTYSLSADGIQQIIILTQAEYDDLPETKNTDGVVYLIKE